MIFDMPSARRHRNCCVALAVLVIAHVVWANNGPPTAGGHGINRLETEALMAGESRSDRRKLEGVGPVDGRPSHPGLASRAIGLLDLHESAGRSRKSGTTSKKSGKKSKSSKKSTGSKKGGSKYGKAGYGTTKKFPDKKSSDRETPRSDPTPDKRLEKEEPSRLQMCW